MIFWLDAQLPPQLASHLARSHGVQAYPLRDIGLRDARDEEVFNQARREGLVVITKDQDFIELSLRLGPPPQILWLTCGNCGNARLRAIFDRTFPQALELRKAGEPIVEISG